MQTGNSKQYFDKCAGDLTQTSYHTAHGISAETCARFNIGFDGNYNTVDRSTYPATPTSWQALIVPVGEAGYIAINTDPHADSKNHIRRTGKAEPFNMRALEAPTRPVFVTDDILEALSIIEAGGEAIALELTGSTEQRAGQLTDTVNNYIANKKPERPLIVALGGRSEEQELIAVLEERYISYYRADIAGDYISINRALRFAPEELREAIKDAEEQEARELEKARAEYYKQSAYYSIDDFMGGIRDSVNTPAISTGFKMLDAVLDGGLYEGLYICGAVTSLGKTTLIMQIADQIAQQGRDVLIFSLEMARAELMAKSISRITFVRAERTADAKTARGITDGARYVKYSDRERTLISKAVAEYKEIAGHIFIHEGIGDITTDFIRATVDKHRQYTGHAPVVVVDYVQILAPHNIRATDKQNTDRNITELKRISRDYKTPVIGVSSFNRDNYTGAVNFRAFKESGAIEYGSDVLIGLQLAGADKRNFDSDKAIRQDPRALELVILKNRQGRIGERVAFKYYPLFNYFEEDTAPEPAQTPARII